MIAKYRHLRAACSVGKWPQAFTARRSRALIESIAFVLQDDSPYSPVEEQEKHEPTHAFSQSRIIAVPADSAALLARAQIAKDLKPVYVAVSESEALDRFAEFSGKWKKRCPS